jgi:peptidoglycan/LPS O-acetylase OafA/YrhL
VNTSANHKIPSLGGLRALSILCVITSHLFQKANSNSFFLKDLGHLGVNVFFVISGYLITYLLIQEETNKATVSLKNFYIRRTIRIFPAFYFLLLIYFILQLLGLINISTASWLASITYTKYLFGSGILTDHFWSLSVEEHYYLLWPLVFVSSRKYRQHFAFLIVFLIPIIRYLSQCDLSLFHHRIIGSSLGMAQRMDAIMWGCIFAMNRIKITNQIVDRISRRPFLFYLPFFAFAASLLFGSIANIIKGPVPKVEMAFFGPIGSVTSISIGCIIILSVESRKGIWFNTLNLKVLEYIGKLSYSLYLWQQFFIFGVDSIFPCTVFYIFVAATVSYHLIERPFLKLKDKFEVNKLADLHNQSAILVSHGRTQNIR